MYFRLRFFAFELSICMVKWYDPANDKMINPHIGLRLNSWAIHSKSGFRPKRVM